MNINASYRRSESFAPRNTKHTFQVVSLRAETLIGVASFKLDS